MVQHSKKAPFTISDRYNELVMQVDALQRKMNGEQHILSKTLLGREIRERQAEMEKLMSTMVEEGDLQYIPWIKNGEIKPEVKNLHLNR
jgi:hypothetical protein